VRKMPEKMTLTTQLSKLSGFMLECATETYPHNFYQTAVNTVNQFDSSLQVQRLRDRQMERHSFVHYSYEFMKKFSHSSTRTRKQLPLQFQDRPLPIPHLTINDNQQKKFDEQFQSVLSGDQREFLQIQKKLYLKVIEKNVLSAIYEVKVVHVADQRPTPQPLTLMKVLFAVTNGTVEYVQFIAANEDWHYLSTNPKQVDLSKESRYDVFRRLSSIANFLFQTLPQLEVRQYVMQVLTCLLRLANAYFLQPPCIHCKKYLKDFTLPVPDGRFQKHSHESCR
jgi:hypothetical protein